MPHLRVYLKDKETGEYVFKEAKEGETQIEWLLSKAVQDLVNELAKKLEKSPMEVMFGSPPFHIIAEWKE